MDRRSQLSRWAFQLKRLSADGDWGALAALDRELATLLPKLSKQQPWTREERAALDELRRAHDAALECCGRQFARIDDRLSQMRSRRDGWMAYAMGNGLEEERA